MNIITHSGKAHRDDLLACSVILACIPEDQCRECRIIRIPHAETPKVGESDYVVDVGKVYDPHTKKFDHHQDATLPCSLSLVLTHFGMLDSAHEWLPWVEFTDIMDVNGPTEAAEWLDIRLSTLARVQSPVESAVLRAFERKKVIVPGTLIHNMLLIIGRDIVDGLRKRVARMALLKRQAVVELHENTPSVIYFLDDVEDPELCMRAFRYHHAQQAEIFVVRSTGVGAWKLARFEDKSGIDFRTVADSPEIAFCHNTGFAAVTKNLCDTETLQKLIAKVRMLRDRDRDRQRKKP